MDSMLTKVTIPASVTSIGNIAFSGCVALLEVYFEGNAPEPAGDYVFSDTPENLTVYIKENATGFEGNVWDDMNIVVMKSPVAEEPDEDKSAETETGAETTDKEQTDKGQADKGETGVNGEDSIPKKDDGTTILIAVSLMLFGIFGVLAGSRLKKKNLFNL